MTSEMGTEQTAGMWFAALVVVAIYVGAILFSNWDTPTDLYAKERRFVTTHPCELIYESKPHTKYDYQTDSVVTGDIAREYKCAGVDDSIWIHGDAK